MWQELSSVELKDWLTVAAIGFSPLVALRVQEALLRRKDRRGRKEWIFNTLMMSRGERLSIPHVQALNMIELAFYGRHRWWHRLTRQSRQSAQETAVTDAWAEYRAHLSTQVPTDAVGSGQWTGQSQELFVNMLAEIARDIPYDFDRTALARGGYTPTSHGQAFWEQESLRKLAIDLLAGTTPLKLEVVKLPTDPEAAAAFKSMVTKMAGSVTEDHALAVRLVPPPAAAPEPAPLAGARQRPDP